MRFMRKAVNKAHQREVSWGHMSMVSGRPSSVNQSSHTKPAPTRLSTACSASLYGQGPWMDSGHR